MIKAGNGPELDGGGVELRISLCGNFDVYLIASGSDKEIGGCAFRASLTLASWQRHNASQQDLRIGDENTIFQAMQMDSTMGTASIFGIWQGLQCICDRDEEVGMKIS